MNVQGALKKRDTADKISNVRGAWVMLFCYSKLVFELRLHSSTSIYFRLNPPNLLTFILFLIFYFHVYLANL